VLDSEHVRVRCFVVDNGGSGGERLKAALDPRVRVISTTTNLGYTGAGNVALEYALAAQPPAEFVVVAAHDVLLERDTLHALVTAARTDPRIGVLGPVLTAPAVQAGGWWRGWRANSVSVWDESRLVEDRDWVSGTLLFIRPDCALDVGGFDEALGSYVEDVDLCLRARDRGWRVGLATRARAAGVGSGSVDVTFMVDVNSVVLAVKRSGLRARRPILMRYVYWSVRGMAAACLPGRPPERRRSSVAHARDHARAILRILQNRGELRKVALNPDEGVKRLREGLDGKGAPMRKPETG
jgi:glycosyltransferase involved in cell wall biosynthesis